MIEYEPANAQADQYRALATKIKDNEKLVIPTPLAIESLEKAAHRLRYGGIGSWINVPKSVQVNSEKCPGVLLGGQILKIWTNGWCLF